MKQIKIADRTLCRGGFSFREKLEIAKLLDKLNADVIELPEIANVKADTLLIKTMLSFVKNSVVSVAAGSSEESLRAATEAVSGMTNTQIRIELPVSAVGMEYICHCKDANMLKRIESNVEGAVRSGVAVEFCAVDATRAEPEFLKAALEAAVRAGATQVSIFDNAAEQPPERFARLVSQLKSIAGVPVGVFCDNKNSLAVAQAMLAVNEGADTVKTAADDTSVSLECLVSLIKNCGDNFGVTCGASYTELNRIIRQIERLSGALKNNPVAVPRKDGDETFVRLDRNDDRGEVVAATARLGYDLSDEDQERVYAEFVRVAEKKKIGAKELDAIVASVALQVPATYCLDNYSIHSGNIVSPSAQIVLKKGSELLPGIGMGDGPIDAAFLTLEKILGRHFELDEFQIQAVTEGHEAMGSAFVKLRHEGKLYSGTGISTDIIGASIRAYLSAVNKIVYEEAQE